MKTLGVIGGLNWECTSDYHKRLKRILAGYLGRLHPTPMILHSFNFDRVQRLQHVDDWSSCSRLFRGVAHRLQGAGAEGLIICANPMHVLTEEVVSAVSVPLVRITEATAKAALGANMKTVALIGVSCPVERNAHRRELESYGLKVLVPDADEQGRLIRIINEELRYGVIRSESKREFYRIVDRLSQASADGVILGCAEFSHINDPAVSTVPLLDAAELHVEAAVKWMLESR